MNSKLHAAGDKETILLRFATRVEATSWDVHASLEPLVLQQHGKRRREAGVGHAINIDVQAPYHGHFSPFINQRIAGTKQ